MQTGELYKKECFMKLIRYERLKVDKYYVHWGYRLKKSSKKNWQYSQRFQTMPSLRALLSVPNRPDIPNKHVSCKKNRHIVV